MDITFFVPCKNEEKNIYNTLENIFYSIGDYNYEILIVDDGSTDKTLSIINKFKLNYKDVNLKTIIRSKSLGIGKNYFLVSRIALGKYFMLVNGDGVEPKESIKKLIKNIGTAEILIPYFGNNDQRSKFRKNLSLLFTQIVNIFSGNRIKYYNGPVVHLTENLKYSRTETFGYGYQAEIICDLLLNGKSYSHIEISNSDRQWGTSKAFALSNFISVANSLIHILMRRIREKII
jgi:glycosyltransferase involved in cell wall biosynthesis